ncbi:MAG: trimethylamine methyltransferase family protein, partial [Thermodesulfobacteriota bacterium]
VYFGTGSEANIWLETRLEGFESRENPGVRVKLPRHVELRGTTELLERAARLCDQLENVDFFIRPLNIQDDDVDENNHDVNKFFASLNNITKHVQAGLTDRECLGDVLRLAERVAGGPDALRENPIISFIACLFKSPLQIVDDTAAKVFDIVETGLPLVLSSSPQGGSTAPIEEAGMVAQINAELLASITLTQLIREGAPVIYGSVPVRARLDNLHDLYGCPEFNHYGVDCVQMARFYRIPCYSSSGVGDAKVPGMQAMFEKMLTHAYMAMSGAQYIHYSFGLLDRTNIFSPLQAVIDNEQVGMVKQSARASSVDEACAAQGVRTVSKVMDSPSRLFARHARRAMHDGTLSSPYRFETTDASDRVIERAMEYMGTLEAQPARHLAPETIDQIFNEVPGLLPRLKRAA